ncbi:redox-active disulfide protein 2 [hydrothermal vent metagenome]|uniref:Redox-active disulfide protein 2 n=1 Tax=hydrothermal vent metagenome TaxID=652676 RepID=A0A1W1EBT4_9ZZZZ
MEIKVLGSECCSNCDTQMKIVKSALEATGISATVEKVEDMVEVMNYGVMSTPAIVIDGEVKTRGKVLREQEVIDLLKEQ